MIASPAKSVDHAAASAFQRTLGRSATITGIGFFSARDVSVRLVPAEPGHGLVFVRTDLAGTPSSRHSSNSGLPNLDGRCCNAAAPALR